jgi:hypothetical protein
MSANQRVFRMAAAGLFAIGLDCEQLGFAFPRGHDVEPPLARPVEHPLHNRAKQNGLVIRLRDQIGGKFPDAHFL